MQQTISRGTEPRKSRKRKRLRSCLFVFLGYLAVSYVIVCFTGGCCAVRAWNYTDPRLSELDRRHYDLSPDGREIVYSSVQRIWHKDGWGNWARTTEGRKFEKRIPVDPVPDGMFLFTLVVEEDPFQPIAYRYTLDGMHEPWWEHKRIFSCPLERLGEDGAVMDGSGAETGSGSGPGPGRASDRIQPGDTFLLKVNPNDLPCLSEPFFVTQETRDKKARLKTILVYPLGNEGNRYRMLTSGRDHDPQGPLVDTLGRPAENLEPFEEEFDAIAKQDDKPDRDGFDTFLCLGGLMLDLVLWPAELLYGIGWFIVHAFTGQPLFTD